MARIRTIKPEFWSSEQVMECSRNARLLFIGVWNFADDDGRMAYSAKRLKAQVFPGDDLTSENVHALITELTVNGLTILYVVDGKEYLQVTGWHHQVINRPNKSKIPPQPTDGSRNVHGVHTAGREKEGKGREGSQSESKQASHEQGAARARSEPVDNPAGWLRQEICKAFEAANSPNIPDTGKAEVWIAQGYDPKICAAVVRDVLAKKPDLRGLNYFDKPIAEAHANKPQQRQNGTADSEPLEARQDRLASFWSKTHVWHNAWNDFCGGPPDDPRCTIPAEILRKHGIEPKTEAA